MVHPYSRELLLWAGLPVDVQASGRALHPKTASLLSYYRQVAKPTADFKRYLSGADQVKGYEAIDRPDKD